MKTQEIKSRLSKIASLNPKIKLTRTGLGEFAIGLTYDTPMGRKAKWYAENLTHVLDFDDYWQGFSVRHGDFMIDVDINIHAQDMWCLPKSHCNLYLVEEFSTVTDEWIDVEFEYDDMPFIQAVVSEPIAKIVTAYNPDKYGAFAEVPMGFETINLFHGSADSKEFNLKEPMKNNFWVTDKDGHELRSFNNLADQLRYVDYLIENPDAITDPSEDNFNPYGDL